MEELIVTQGQGFRPTSPAVRDAMAAYQTAAWRAPSATRFDSRPANDVIANDFIARAEAVAPTHVVQPVAAEPMPRWTIFALGALVAAILGAVLGGMMSL